MVVSMDALIAHRADAPVQVSQHAPAMPAEMPLAMPTQSLTSWSVQERARPFDKVGAKATILARLFVFGGGLLVTTFGAWQMYEVIAFGGIAFLEYVLLALFIVNFSWIAIAFSSGLLGFLSLLRGRSQPLVVPATLQHRTAVVMPIYNEAPSRVFAAIATMAEEVASTGLAANFDFFLLSDTTNPDIWVAEERAFQGLRQHVGPDIRVYYRHRPQNTARKAGNIADFVGRWGGAYEHMLVLDADSLMTGHSIVGLAHAMESDPAAGIIQTLPLIINRNTLFARLQQFAARIHGPVIAEGLRLWMGKDGNYWGHNAIIRTKAFADHCGLPDLHGRPPFGGHILSHDFVEAALIRRAGWSVIMVPGLVGSYEESPPSLIDLAGRDRRWCQGNMQHMRVIGAAGLRLASRQHFATGIMSYLASPFWLMQLVVGIAIVLQSIFIRPEYFAGEFSLFPTWPSFDAERSLALFGITMAILLAPKLFGLIVALMRTEERRACGGPFRLMVSSIVEVIGSALLAPVMMLIQSSAVFEILLGRDSGWKPQRRDDGSIPFSDIVRNHRGHVMLGLIAGLSAFLIAPSLFAWMSPTIVGLVLAVQMSWMSGSLRIGLWLKRYSILMTPEEKSPPPVAVAANALTRDFAQRGWDETDSLFALHADAQLRQCHLSMLPLAAPRARGKFNPDRALAEAKLAEAQSIAEAANWLQPRERMIVLHDRALLGVLASLPQEQPTPVKTA
jgi:membrane glycosyltransferase